MFFGALRFAQPEFIAKERSEGAVPDTFLDQADDAGPSTGLL
jgi:hypothetical protein